MSVRSDRLPARAAFVAAAAVVLGAGFVMSATTAESLDGAYRGTYSGSASGAVEFSVAGSDVTVTQPGSGSGTVSGSTITMVVGNATVGDRSCEYESSGQLTMDGSGEATASGTWNARCADGVTGNGSWAASRPAPSASPTPSPTSSPSGGLTPRTLSLTATPRKLSGPGRTTLTASASACEPGGSIVFQVRREGRFRPLATVAADEDCSASYRKRIARRTTFRAQSPSDGTYATARSTAISVRVERR